MTGANILDIAYNGVNTGMLRYFGGDRDDAVNLIDEAYGYVHGEVVVHHGLKVDGILPDGSFGQHRGILYDGTKSCCYWNEQGMILLFLQGTMGVTSECDLACCKIFCAEQSIHPFSTNLVLSLELDAAGTRWEAGATCKEAFASHIDGSYWMIYRNNVTDGLHWDIVSALVNGVAMLQLLTLWPVRAQSVA